MHKQSIPDAPVPPDVVLPWADLEALKIATNDFPSLNPVAAVLAEPDEHVEHVDSNENEEVSTNPQYVQRQLDDHPEVAAAYEEFRPSWEDWAQECCGRQSIQDVYVTLFAMHSELQIQGELVEVVLGLGLLQWQIPGGERIRRHIVRASVDLNFDPDSGVIRVKCASAGAELKVEEDILDPNLRPNDAHTQRVGAQLQEIGDAVWDRARLEAALKSWAEALHADAQWSPDLEYADTSDATPRITLAPAIILRKRGQQRGMLRIYDSLIDRLGNENEAITAGWKRLVNAQHDLEKVKGVAKVTGISRNALASGWHSELLEPDASAQWH